MVLQETMPELSDNKFLKMDQNLHTNMEGFSRASHILIVLLECECLLEYIVMQIFAPYTHNNYYISNYILHT